MICDDYMLIYDDYMLMYDDYMWYTYALQRGPSDSDVCWFINPMNFAILGGATTCRGISLTYSWYMMVGNQGQVQHGDNWYLMEYSSL